MTQVAHSERAHSELGASVAERWMSCPGSVQLSRQFPQKGSSVHAEEGTAAHELAERALAKQQDPTMWLGMTINGFEVTEEMCDFVRIYTDYCRELMRTAEKTWVEHKFNLNGLRPPAPMYGTNDFAAYVRETKTLHIVDLKYGSGVVVEVKGNKQLRYYALGAVLSPEFQGLEIERVHITIVQPRASHADGPVRTEVVTIEDLMNFTGDLLAAAVVTQQPDAPLVAGRHCKFCPASGSCPAQTKQAEEVAMVEFAALPTKAPPIPEAMPQGMFEDILAKLPILESWIKAMYARGLKQLEAGEAVKGYKLVQKRAQRKWTDEATAAQHLEAMGEKKEDLFEPPSLKSPAQIEKLIGKKNMPTQFVSAVSSGTTMVPDTDPRPAVVAGEEFGALPSGK